MKLLYFFAICMCVVTSGLDWETIQSSVELGDIDILKDLIQQEDIDKTNGKQDKTALIIAIEQQKEDIVQGLIDMKASINLENVLRSGAKQPIHHACAHGNLKIVQMLIRAKAKVNALSDNEFQTPLMQAIYHKSAPIVAELIKFRADVNFVDEISFMSETPLLHALHRSDEVMVRQLVVAKANIDKGNTWFGETPLIIACQRGLTSIAEFLLESKANFHRKDISGNTALHFATDKQATKLICQLIKSNADLNISNGRLERPIENLRGQCAKDVKDFILELEEAKKPDWMK